MGSSVDACLVALDDPGVLAVGIDPAIDDATAGRASAQMRPKAEMMRTSGRFGPEVAATGTDALARFVAFAGRTSVRNA